MSESSKANPRQCCPAVTCLIQVCRPGGLIPTVFWILAVAVAAGVPSVAIANEVLMRKARATITTAEIGSHIEVLADDTFEGREAGSRGGRAAANYLTQYLKGLQPAAPGGRYFQTFGAGYRNLLGMLEGTDPSLKNEYILIMAHYDHVGYGSRQNSYGPFGYVHNGADDNASGTAAMLELIDAFVKTDLKCARTILFAFWDGEEKGLLGSEHWASNPTVPLSQIKLAINMDMVGRLRRKRVEVYGTQSMPGLRGLTSSANDSTRLNLDYLWEVKDNSDHYSFFKRRIPILMYHTGLHSNYHRPSDDAHLVNFDGVRELSDLAFNTLFLVANEPELRGFRQASVREGSQDRRVFERPLPAPAARLGISWSREPVADGGYSVTSVQPGSAADRAGLRTDDIVVEFNGRPVEIPRVFQTQVATAPTNSAMTIRREGEAEPLTLDIKLDGRPTRLGLTWRENSAEPGALTVVRLVRHAPADVAGLKIRDRIHQINGQSFENGKAFLEHAGASPFPIKLHVERSGRRLDVTLQAAE